MKKERLGFKEGDLLIMKSPVSGIAAKVELQKDGTAVASLMKSTELMELEKVSKQGINKNILLIGLVLFYLAITGGCIFVSGSFIGIVAGLFFFTTTGIPLRHLLPQVLYACKYKEEVQYASIYRKVYECYNTGQEISTENITNITNTVVEQIYEGLNCMHIRLIILGTALTGVILSAGHINLGIIIGIDVIILLIVIYSTKNEKLTEKIKKLNELLVYRQPTEEQIDNVVFGFRFLKNCEESPLAKWYYFH